MKKILGKMRKMMNKETFLSYISVILIVGLVYLFGELKHEKYVAKAKELWLLEDTAELEQEVERLNEVVQVLAKKNKEYEMLLAIVKYKVLQEQEKNKPANDTQEPPKPPMSNIPKLDPNYPGEFIPKGQIPPGSPILKI